MRGSLLEANELADSDRSPTRSRGNAPIIGVKLLTRWALPVWNRIATATRMAKPAPNYWSQTPTNWAEAKSGEIATGCDVRVRLYSRSHVRTLHERRRSGRRHQGLLARQPPRLAPALQHRPRPADARRPPRRGRRRRGRPPALRPDPRLGEGPQARLQDDQRPRRDPDRAPRLPVAAANRPLPDRRRRLLRVARHAGRHQA